MWNLQKKKKKCDVYGEECFSQKKMFPNGLNMDLPQQVQVEKTVNEMQTH